MLLSFVFMFIFVFINITYLIQGPRKKRWIYCLQSMSRIISGTHQLPQRTNRRVFWLDWCLWGSKQINPHLCGLNLCFYFPRYHIFCGCSFRTVSVNSWHAFWSIGMYIIFIKWTWIWLALYSISFDINIFLLLLLCLLFVKDAGEGLLEGQDF